MIGPPRRSAPNARPDARAALAVAAAAAAAFAALAIVFMTPIGAEFDIAVIAEVQRAATPRVVVLMGLLTRLGNEFIVVWLPFIFFWLWRRRWRLQATELVVATVGGQLLNDALKLVFHRARPSVVTSVIPAQGFSFPSGHAMVSVVFYGALAVIGWRVLRGRSRIAWVTAMSAVVVVVGVSRLFLDVHYPTDVLASWAGGLLWLEVSLVLVDTLAARRRDAPRSVVRPA